MAKGTTRNLRRRGPGAEMESRIKAWRLASSRRFTPSRSAGRGNGYCGFCRNISTISKILFHLSMTSYFRGVACFGGLSTIPLTVATDFEGSRMTSWDNFRFLGDKTQQRYPLRIAPVSTKRRCGRMILKFWWQNKLIIF